jgi:two-component system chemotaxis sensor kinase CheA
LSDIFRIFENIQEPMFIIDGELNVHWGNSAALQILEVSARRLASGKPLASFIEFKQGVLQEGQDLASIEEPSASREIDFTTAGGGTGSGQISIQSVPEVIREASGADSKRWIVYIRNVTLEKILADKFKAQLDAKEAVIGELEKARAELENYSKNLEKMVEARTTELREANRLVSTILNSLGQGIFVFDRNAQTLPFYSKVSERMFGVAPSNKNVADVLRLEGSERETFKKWVEAVFEEMLDFQDLVPLGPSRLTTSADKHIAFDFHPMRTEQGALQGVVLVATDKTEEMKARKEAERERSFAKRIVQIVQHRQQFKTFVSEAKRITSRLSQSLTSPTGLDHEEVARDLHTIKGGAASFSLIEIAERAHHCEDILSQFAKANEIMPKEWPNGLRMQLKSGIDLIIRLLNEFLQNHSFLAGSSENVGRTVEIPVSTLTKWYERIHSPQFAQVVSEEIFENWMKEPAEKLFAHVDGSMRELAQRLGKTLKPVKFIGGDLRVVPEYYLDLFGTYVHAFRNAVDHGIETPGERIAAGKEVDGQITIQFERFEQGGQFWIKTEIGDDGRGIDPIRIKRRLDEKRLAYDASAPDEETIQAVFRDDFSTANAVTDVSGRGIGLSAIKAQAEKMGGEAFVRSVVGKGSILTVVVPDLQILGDQIVRDQIQADQIGKIKQAG